MKCARSSTETMSGENKSATRRAQARYGVYYVIPPQGLCAEMSSGSPTLFALFIHPCKLRAKETGFATLGRLERAIIPYHPPRSLTVISILNTYAHNVLAPVNFTRAAELVWYAVVCLLTICSDCLAYLSSVALRRTAFD